MKKIPEEIIHEILDNVPQVIWTAEADGTVDYYSKGWEDLTGISTSEGLGIGWAVALHPEDEQKTWDAWNHSVQTGDFYEIEHRIKSGNGYKWVLSRARAVKDDKGNITKWYGTALDIDQRKKAEAELQEAQNTYKLVGESIDYGVWRTNAEGRLEYISKSFLELLGIKHYNLKSIDWPKHIDAETRQTIEKKWREWGGSDAVFEQEFQIKTVTGEEKVILSRGKPIYDSKKSITGWVGINLDITEIKRNEEQLSRSLKEKELLLFELNHRVKNNLQLITSLISLQINVNDDPRVKEELEETKMRLSAIALLYDKLNETRSINRLNLNNYISSLVEILKVLNKKVKVNIDVDSVICSTRFAVNIGLLLNEIVTNSYKYAFPGGAAGTVTLSIKMKNDHLLLIRVGDNGVGLPKNFEKIKNESFGSQIIQTLISQEGGTFNITSGSGTLYEIEIPLPQDCL